MIDSRIRELYVEKLAVIAQEAIFNIKNHGSIGKAEHYNSYVVQVIDNIRGDGPSGFTIRLEMTPWSTDWSDFKKRV